MSLVWEPNSNTKRDRGRVVPFVFQAGSEATANQNDTEEREAVATDKRAADEASPEKPAKILRMRY